MQLIEVYNQLSFGELRNVMLGTGALDTSADGSMPAANQQRILPLIKGGLTELHKRFLLREVTDSITLTPGLADYALTPADDDVLKVERIYGTWDALEYEIPINEVGNPLSIRTPTPTSLIVPIDTVKAPWLLETTTLSLIYRADHAFMAAIADNDLATTVITLPRSHLRALTLYVASQVANPVGFAGDMHEGNNYAIKFEQEVAALKGQNFEIDSNYENNKLAMRGLP
jgi:hypothetical protein